jgi:hypothetical protein
MCHDTKTSVCSFRSRLPKAQHHQANTVISKENYPLFR